MTIKLVTMIVVSASKFKAGCLKWMDHVQSTGEIVVITKHGRAVAELTAPKFTDFRSKIGGFTDQTEVKGDIVSPTGEPWDAEK